MTPDKTTQLTLEFVEITNENALGLINAARAQERVGKADSTTHVQNAARARLMVGRVLSHIRDTQGTARLRRAVEEANIPDAAGYMDMWERRSQIVPMLSEPNFLLSIERLVPKPRAQRADHSSDAVVLMRASADERARGMPLVDMTEQLELRRSNLIAACRADCKSILDFAWAIDRGETPSADEYAIMQRILSDISTAS
jgi:hypothetical protein